MVSFNLFACPYWSPCEVYRCKIFVYTVNRYPTRGESEDHRWESMQKGNHPGFETQGRRHQKSKTGYQWATKRTEVLQKVFFKKIFLYFWIAVYVVHYLLLRNAT